MRNDLIVRQVLLNGKMVVEFNLFHYRHAWLTPYLLVVEQVKGWVAYEILKYEPSLLLVREVGRLKDIWEVERCLRE